MSSKPFSPEVRERSVRLVMEHQQTLAQRSDVSSFADHPLNP
ncbi:hypothetical protein [Budvicia aquatica]|nr:hypothetical protein [Budvicia aquatica]